MVWGFKSKFKWGDTSTDIWGFANPNDIDPESQAIYDRIIADGGVSNLIRLNYFVVGLKTIYGSLSNVPVCYDAHWIGYKLGSGTGATAGQAAAKLYSLTVAGDAVQTTAASQPLLLAHNGASSDNYWWGSGVSGNYVSTPNAVANQITDNLELIAQASLKWQSISATDYDLIGKFSGAAEGYILRYNGSAKTLVLVTNLGGFTTYSSTATITAVNDAILWVKITRQRSNGEVKFFTSPDGITYTQLGSTVSGSTAAINVGSSVVEIGSRGVGTTASTLGKIYRATISNSIGGTPVVDFNPASYNASTSQTAWTSATGEVWTINTGTAATGYKGVLVNRTIVMSDGVDDRLTATVNRPNILTQYIATNTYTNDNTANAVVVDSNSGAWLNAIVAFTSVIGNLMNTYGSDLTKAKPTNILFLATTSNNSGVKNAISVNNGTETTNTYSPSLSGTGLNLFTRSGGGTKANANINTYICVNVQSDATERTATYNLIRSLNNNAF
jgi:hypothetical protein